MIKYLYANNYKSLVNFRIEFDQLNLMIGNNGTGKSSVLKLIIMLRDFINGGSRTLSLFLPGSTTKWMKSEVQTFELGLEDEKYSYSYMLEVAHLSDPKQSVVLLERVQCDEKIIYEMNQGKAIMVDDRGDTKELLVDPTISGVGFVPQDGVHTKLSAFRKQIDSIILCSPMPSLMQNTIQNDVFMPNINCTNIASVYSGLVQIEPQVYNDLIDALKRYNPTFIRTRLDIRNYNKYLVFDFKYNDIECNYLLGELSEGEKTLFALNLILYGFIKRGYTVLLDEPDNYVSLKEIQPWCINLEDMIEDNGQCLIISHHPEVIDFLAETRGKWFTRLRSGESKVRDKLDIDENKDLLTYSQMISRGYLDEIE